MIFLFQDQKVPTLQGTYGFITIRINNRVSEIKNATHTIYFLENEKIDNLNLYILKIFNGCSVIMNFLLKDCLYD